MPNIRLDDDTRRAILLAAARYEKFTNRTLWMNGFGWNAVCTTTREWRAEGLVSVVPRCSEIVMVWAD